MSRKAYIASGLGPGCTISDTWQRRRRWRRRRSKTRPNMFQNCKCFKNMLGRMEIIFNWCRKHIVCELTRPDQRPGVLAVVASLLWDRESMIENKWIHVNALWCLCVGMICLSVLVQWSLNGVKHEPWTMNLWPMSHEYMNMPEVVATGSKLTPHLISANTEPT